jgi:hypothetical protein
MKPLAQVQWITALLLAGSAIAVCQSALPAMAPTMREIEEHAATVEYSEGRVAVVADNSSLNDILRDVARRAGMAVKGSVIDERVFGTYGPAAPAEVLATLLKGTGSNMMVVAGSSHAAELILTPRQGGPTPPNPNAAKEAEAEMAEIRAAEAIATQVDASSEAPSASDDKAAAMTESDGNAARIDARGVDKAPTPEGATVPDSATSTKPQAQTK